MPPKQNRSRTATLAKLAEAYALVLVAAAVALFFTFYGPTSETFPTSANFKIVLADQAVLCVAAFAILVPLICYQFDLSIGATLGLAAIVSADAMSSGASVFVGILLAVGVGVLAGVVNGLVVTKLKVNAVITTLATAIIAAGFTFWISEGSAIATGIPDVLLEFGSQDLLGIPRIAWALLVVFACLHYVLEYTPVGRHLYMVGSSPQAARLVGLRTQALQFGSFVAAGALAGIAGILQVARAGGVDPTVGETFLLPAFAAAFLSAAAVRPGAYTAAGTAIAVFFLAILNSGLNLAGAAPYVNDFVNGLALIIGVALGAYIGRRRTSVSRGSATPGEPPDDHGLAEPKLAREGPA